MTSKTVTSAADSATMSFFTQADRSLADNLAEVARTKIAIVRGLRRLTNTGGLDSAARRFIAERPYLFHPRWEAFGVGFGPDVSIAGLLDASTPESGFQVGDGVGEARLVGTALRRHGDLLVVEIAPPKEPLAWENVSAFKRRLWLLRDACSNRPALGIAHVLGLVVADALEDDPALAQEVAALKKSDVFVYTWSSLLDEAEFVWENYLQTVLSRT